MSPELKQFELNRMVNMMKSFGWNVVESKFEGETVYVTMEKIIEAGRRDVAEFESTRLTNMLKQFEWSLDSTQFQDKKVVSSFHKNVPHSP